LANGWLGSNEVSPQTRIAGGLTSFDPRHPKMDRPNLELLDGDEK